MGSPQSIRTSGLGPILPMGASPCLDVMYDQQFTKDFVYLINRLDPIFYIGIMTAKYY